MPQRTITVPFNRAVAGALATQDFAYPVLTTTATANNTMLLGPVTLPEWMDLSRVITPKILIFGGGNPAVAGQTIDHKLDTTRMPAEGAAVHDSFEFIWAPPATWPTGEPTWLEFLNNAVNEDPVYPGGYFTQGDSVGWLLGRYGLEAADTYTFTTRIAAMLQLTAYVRCQKTCCP